MRGSMPSMLPLSRAKRLDRGEPMAIDPGMVEPLAERTRDLYVEAELRLLGIIAQQLAAGLDAPGWAERKLAAVQAVRRASQAVVTELEKTVSLDVHDAVAEAYNEGRAPPSPNSAPCPTTLYGWSTTSPRTPRPSTASLPRLSTGSPRPTAASCEPSTTGTAPS